MNLRQLVEVLQILMRVHGDEAPVFLATWRGGKVQYGAVTHVDPPELDGDGVTISAESSDVHIEGAGR